MLKVEAAVEGSRGSLIGPLNDIHNETNCDYANSFKKNDHSFNFAFNFSNGIVPLQNSTDERSQVLHLPGVTEDGSQSHDVSTGHEHNDPQYFVRFVFLGICPSSVIVERQFDKKGIQYFDQVPLAIKIVSTLL